ncbi:helix-turn-helix domain-containing protein [bacterium]|nr:helix-turn-helix domain-containing protein [bacterium]
MDGLDIATAGANRRSNSDAALVTPEQLGVWLKLSKRSLWRMRAEGLLPAPLRLRKSVRWRVADIANWIEQGCPAVGQTGN